jgi:transposase-like protein
VATPRKYPDELRERAVRLYREADPKPMIRRLAEQLNVHPEALRNWIRQDQADRGERDDQPTTEMIEENRRLRREVAELKRVKRGSSGRQRLFRGRDRPNPEVVMSFIEAHDFPVDLVLRVLSIPSSTYYGWRARAKAPSPGGAGPAAGPGALWPRQLGDVELLAKIQVIRDSHEFAPTYGSPRVWLELRKQGVRCGRKRVERIMRENRLRGAYLRKGWKGGSTKQNPKHTAAPDLVNRDFNPQGPNRLWVAAGIAPSTGSVAVAGQSRPGSSRSGGDGLQVFVDIAGWSRG